MDATLLVFFFNKITSNLEYFRLIDLKLTNSYSFSFRRVLWELVQDGCPVLLGLALLISFELVFDPIDMCRTKIETRIEYQLPNAKTVVKVE